MADEKKTKVSMDEQFAASNLENYEKSELVDMVNETSGDAEFKSTYSDVDAGETPRQLAYKYLERKCGMTVVPHSVVIPKHASMRDLIDAYEHAQEMEAAEAGVEVIEIEIGKKTERKTLAAEAEVMHQWSTFTSSVTNKSDYLTAALKHFMSDYEAGKVDIEFVGLKPARK